MKLPCDYLAFELKDFACDPDGGLQKWKLTFRRISFDSWDSLVHVPNGQIRRTIKFVAFSRVQRLAEIEAPPQPPAAGPPAIAGPPAPSGEADDDDDGFVLV